MKHLFVILSVLVLTQVASAYVYTCTCRVQRNNGEIAIATATVDAYNEQQAAAISRNPCYQAAVRKFQFLTNFSDPILISHQCGGGAIYDVR